MKKRFIVLLLSIGCTVGRAADEVRLEVNAYAAIDVQLAARSFC